MQILIKTNGKTQVLERELNMGEITKLIQAEVLDCVNLHNGYVMLVDDLGHQKQKPKNQKATNIYQQVCQMSTDWQIVGDVVLTRDGD
jgi:hypothetical protein